MKTDSVKKKTSAVKSNEGLPIRYDLYYPENSLDKQPLIIFLHGFKGFKNWGTFPTLCQHIASEGFAVIAMNFSLNGIGENKMEFDRLDLFGRDTMSNDLDDVGSMIASLKNGEITASDVEFDLQKIGVWGHSRGGQTAIAAAAEYDAIQCLVSWSAVADYNARWSDQMINDWQTEGVTEIKNGRTGQIMPMKKVVYDDARENAERVIALNRVDELEIPALFMHAEGDEAVSSKNAKQLYNVCTSAEKELILLPNTGHTFGGTHPFEGEELPESLQNAVQYTMGWFKKYIK